MTDQEQNLAGLLSQLSEMRLRALGIEAIRRVRRTGDRNSTVTIDPNTVMRELGPLLREAGNADRNLALPALGDDSLTKPWATPLLQFFVWLQRAGLAFLYGGTMDNPPRRVRLLPPGLAFFDREDDEHPFVPGWLARLQRRCPNLSDDVVELIEDGHACFDHQLLRPAVALLGVALESLVISVRDSLVQRGLQLTPTNPRNAAERIASVRSAIVTRFPGNTGADLEARGAALRACEFADNLRTRRNDASHPVARFPFDDPNEVENFFLRASTNIPGLWAMT